MRSGPTVHYLGQTIYFLGQSMRSGPTVHYLGQNIYFLGPSLRCGLTFPWAEYTFIGSDSDRQSLTCCFTFSGSECSKWFHISRIRVYSYIMVSHFPKITVNIVVPYFPSQRIHCTLVQCTLSCNNLLLYAKYKLYYVKKLGFFVRNSIAVFKLLPRQNKFYWKSNRLKTVLYSVYILYLYSSTQ